MKKFTWFPLVLVVAVLVCLPVSALAGEPSEQTVLSQSLAEYLAAEQKEKEQFYGHEIGDEIFYSWLEEENARMQNYLVLDKSELENVKNNQGLSEKRHNQLQEQLTKELSGLQKYSGKNTEVALAEIVDRLFWLRGINYDDDSDYDFTVFMTEKLDSSVNYFIDYSLHTKAFSKAVYTDTDTRRFHAFVTDVSLTQGKAVVTADVQEYYFYQDHKMGAGWYTFQVSFTNSDGTWLISGIQSDAPEEAGYIKSGYEGYEFDTEASIKRFFEPLSEEEIKQNQEAERKRQEDLKLLEEARRAREQLLKQMEEKLKQKYQARGIALVAKDKVTLSCCKNFLKRF